MRKQWHVPLEQKSLQSQDTLFGGTAIHSEVIWLGLHKQSGGTSAQHAQVPEHLPPTPQLWAAAIVGVSQWYQCTRQDSGTPPYTGT